MAEIVRMPKMSDTMTEGVVAKWHKKVGDSIKSGDLVAEIETDKATMEFESYQNGTLLYIGIPEGKGAPVDSILAILGKSGEDYKTLLEKETATQPANPIAKTENKKDTPTMATVVAEVKQTPITPAKSEIPLIKQSQEFLNNGKIKASPLAKKLAEEKGINLNLLKGTGDGGRVVKRDIDWYKPADFINEQPVFSQAILTESYVDTAVSQMRKTIAKRLAESKFSAPHFYLTMDIDMEESMKARESINQVTGLKISYNDIVIKAAAYSLKQHPKINSSWLGDTIRTNHHIHIGVAVAVEEGLLVPVVRFADSKTLSQINAEVKNYAQKAKDKKLQPTDWEGNTFTISNLGMFDIEEFTAIINPPDACIMAIGSIKETPVVKKGNVVAGYTMRVTLSCDHRVVDGVSGAKFLQTFKGFMENPVVLLGQQAI